MMKSTIDFYFKIRQNVRGIYQIFSQNVTNLDELIAIEHRNLMKVKNVEQADNTGWSPPATVPTMRSILFLMFVVQIEADKD